MTPASYAVAKLSDSQGFVWWLNGEDQPPIDVHIDHLVSPVPITHNGVATLLGRRDGKPHWVDVTPEAYTQLRSEVKKIFPMKPITFRGKPTIYGFRGLY